MVDVGTDLGLAAAIYSNASMDVEVKRAGYPFNFMFLDLSVPLDGHQIRAAVENWIAAGPSSVSRNWAVSSGRFMRVRLFYLFRHIKHNCKLLQFMFNY